jgi:hypothetical protein
LYQPHGPVPENGSPASQDYNDTQSENLDDHATFAAAFNDIIRPILLALPAAAAQGLLGAALYTDTSDQTALCFNPLTNTPLTVKQSLQYLQAIVTSMLGQLTNVNTQVGVLNSKLSSTNQNDIALALQNFQSALNQQANALKALQQANGAASTLQQATPVIDPSGQETVQCNWTPVQTDDSYTVAVSIEDASGYLEILSWSYIVGGLGLNVIVRNTDRLATHQGIVHVCAIA